MLNVQTAMLQSDTSLRHSPRLRLERNFEADMAAAHDQTAQLRLWCGGGLRL
jgi:hypothetical protein